MGHFEVANHVNSIRSANENIVKIIDSTDQYPTWSGESGISGGFRTIIQNVSSRIDPIEVNVATIVRLLGISCTGDSRVIVDQHNTIIAKNEMWISKTPIDNGKIMDKIRVAMTPIAV